MRGGRVARAADVPAASVRRPTATAKILDTDAQLYFHLQLQKLIELIRQGDFAQALTFAQEELAPRGEENVRRPPMGRCLWRR